MCDLITSLYARTMDSTFSDPIGQTRGLETWHFLHQKPSGNVCGPTIIQPLAHSTTVVVAQARRKTQLALPATAVVEFMTNWSNLSSRSVYKN